MKQFGNFSLLLLAVLLTWAAVVFGIVLLIEVASLAGIAILCAIIVIAYLANLNDQPRKKENK